MMFKQICFLTGVTGVVAALGSSLLPSVNAQITEQIQVGRTPNVPVVEQGTPGTPPPLARTNFEGRGVVQGSAFTRGRLASIALTMDGSNFGFELLGAPHEGTRARVQYSGTVARRTNSSTDSGNFTLDGRVQSFDSSANAQAIKNTTGTCRIEVFDSRVISSSCRTVADASSTQFLGLEQF